MALFGGHEGLNLSIDMQRDQQQELLASAKQLPMPSPDDAEPEDGLLSPASATASRLDFLSSALSAAGFASLDFPTALEGATNAPLQPQQLAAIVDGIAAIWGERQRCQNAMQQVSLEHACSASSDKKRVRRG